MAKIGYARTSTVDQEAGLAWQTGELEAWGAEKIFREQVSSVAERRELEKMLDYIREGDVVGVTRLDRLARSVRDLLAISDQIKRKGATLHVFNLGDTGTATGELVFLVIGAIAQFERKLMLERQREGIAKAHAEGKYKGRPPKLYEKADEMRQLEELGVSRAEIARRFGIARSSVYRILDGEAQGEAA
jgi:DNA invertase Pin-like site-specific DNA recombinase